MDNNDLEEYLRKLKEFEQANIINAPDIFQYHSYVTKINSIFGTISYRFVIISRIVLINLVHYFY